MNQFFSAYHYPFPPSPARGVARVEKDTEKDKSSLLEEYDRLANQLNELVTKYNSMLSTQKSGSTLRQVAN